LFVNRSIAELCDITVYLVSLNDYIHKLQTNRHFLLSAEKYSKVSINILFSYLFQFLFFSLKVTNFLNKISTAN
jgi:hypothetical protein